MDHEDDLVWAFCGRRRTLLEAIALCHHVSTKTCLDKHGISVCSLQILLGFYSVMVDLESRHSTVFSTVLLPPSFQLRMLVILSHFGGGEFGNRGVAVWLECPTKIWSSEEFTSLGVKHVAAMQLPLLLWLFRWRTKTMDWLAVISIYFMCLTSRCRHAVTLPVCAWLRHFPSASCFFSTQRTLQQQQQWHVCFKKLTSSCNSCETEIYNELGKKRWLSDCCRALKFYVLWFWEKHDLKDNQLRAVSLQFSCLVQQITSCQLPLTEHLHIASRH